MARTKNTRRGKKKPPTTQQPNISTEDAEQIDQLVQQAEQLIISSDFDQAKNVCQQVLQLQSDHIKALETMALCELELGRDKSARTFFLKCLNHSQQNPEPTVHLYLAQLAGSPKEALSHYTSALSLLKSKLNQILQAKSTKENDQSNEMDSENQASLKETKPENKDSNATTVHWSVDESQIRRSCSRALVAMTEIYLTDLCFDTSAEEKCLEYLAIASSLDPTDPEPLQTLASVRLSQSERELAKEALLLSWSLWKDKAPPPKEKTDETEEKIDLNQDQIPKMDLNESDDDKREEAEEKANQMMDTFDSKMIIEDEAIIEEEQEDQNVLPPIESRISWAKLAIECEMWNSAIEVLQQCEAEDDEDGEIQYLLAIAWFLLGQSRPQNSTSNQLDTQLLSNQILDSSVAVGDGLGQIECWLEAQEAIETCFQLHKRLGDASGLEKSIFQHIQELMQEFEKAGLAPILQEEDDRKNEIDDNLIDDNDWVDASDVEMD